MRVLGSTTEISDLVERLPLSETLVSVRSVFGAGLCPRCFTLRGGQVVLCGIVLRELGLDVVVDALDFLHKVSGRLRASCFAAITCNVLSVTCQPAQRSVYRTGI